MFCFIIYFSLYRDNFSEKKIFFHIATFCYYTYVMKYVYFSSLSINFQKCLKVIIAMLNCNIIIFYNNNNNKFLFEIF